MKYECIVYGEIQETGSYFCNHCAREIGISKENGELKPAEEWTNWIRDYYSEERDLKISSAKRILEIEGILGKPER